MKIIIERPRIFVPGTAGFDAKFVPSSEEGRLKVDLPIGWDGEERVVKEIGWSGLSWVELEMLRDAPDSISGLIVPSPSQDGAYDILRGEGDVRIENRPYTAAHISVQSFIELNPIALPVSVEAQ